MQQSRSSVRIKTAKVEEQCRKTIKLINEKRTQEDVAVENAHLEKINRRLWRRLRGWLEREYLTNKEKLSISKDNWHYPSCYAWGTLDVAEKLLKAAKRSDDGFVTVSVEDLDLLYR